MKDLLVLLLVSAGFAWVHKTLPEAQSGDARIALLCAEFAAAWLGTTGIVRWFCQRNGIDLVGFS